MDEFKDKVKELRRRRGWTQEDLARAVDVTLPTAQRWERGGFSTLSPGAWRTGKPLSRGQVSMLRRIEVTIKATTRTPNLVLKQPLKV